MSLSVNLVKKREKGREGDRECLGKLISMPSSMVSPGGSYLGVKFQNEIEWSLGNMPSKSSLFVDNKCHTHYLLFSHANKQI